MRIRINFLFAANIRNFSHVVKAISGSWSDETSPDVLCLMNNGLLRLLLLNPLNQRSSLLGNSSKALTWCSLNYIYLSTALSSASSHLSENVDVALIDPYHD